MEPTKSTEKPSRSSDSSALQAAHHEEAAFSSSSRHDQASFDSVAAIRQEANKKLANPLAGLSVSELSRLGENYCREAGLGESEEDLRAFRLGAVLAAGGHAGEDGRGYDVVDGLTAREREVLVREETHKWSQPKKLYFVIVSELLNRTLLNLSVKADDPLVNSLLTLCCGSGYGRDSCQWCTNLLQSVVWHW